MYVAMDTRNHAKTYVVPMATKTLKVLEAFRARAGLSLTETVELCGIPKASAFRLLETLRSSGYVTKTDHGLFRLTYKLLDLAMAAHEINPVRRVALPYLGHLQRRTSETVNLGVFQEDHVVYAEVLESTRKLRAVPRVGAEAPLHATALGKAIAAWLPKKELNQIIRRRKLRRFTPSTIVNKAALFAEFAQVRKQGYAVDKEEETLGCVCVAAPILDSKSRGIYAISICGPASHMPPARISELGNAVREVCQHVRRACGFRGEAVDPAD
jgi:DNA-binding IclR family transcriptional regulator